MHYFTQFLSPPVQVARWAHMRHFLSVTYWMIHISEIIIAMGLKLHRNSPSHIA